MANADAINQVIASIKGEIALTEALGFNMGDFVAEGYDDMSGRNCGTVACIAGHAHILATKDDPKNCFLKSYTVYESGKDYLELDDSDAEDLFYGQGLKTLDTITPEQAIRTLEHLRDTGEVSWEV